MADSEYVDPTSVGPNGFRRMASAIQRFFTGGGGGTFIVSGSGGTAVSDTAASKVEGLSIAKTVQAEPTLKTRQQCVKDKLAVYDNDFRAILTQRLRLSFHPENFNRIKFVLHSSTNVLRRITDDISILYENPAQRSLKEDAKASQTSDGSPDQGNVNQDPAVAPPAAPPLAQDATAPAVTPADIGTGNEEIDALADVLELSGSKDTNEETPFDKLMAAYDLDVLLDSVEKLCTFCPVVWVRPIVTYEQDAQGNNDASTGRIDYRVYLQDTADVVIDPNDPTKAIAFYYYGEEIGPKGMRRVIHFWNSQVYAKLDDTWRLIDNPIPHTLGRLPVTPFQIHLPRNGYYVDGLGEDLYEATLEICLLKTIQNSRAKDSGFKQLALQGDPKNIDQDIVMGGPAPIILGDEGVATILDFQPNLDAFTTMFEQRELSTAGTYGISAAEYKSEGTPVSGFAKKLDRDKVLKESKRRRKFFAKAEQDLYSLTATILKAYPIPSIGQLNPAAVLQVDHAEPTFEEDPQHEMSSYAQKLKFNIMSIIDILRNDNPDLNDVDLVKIANKNKRINDALLSKDQLRLIDLLASHANVGASVGGGGGGTPPAPAEGGKPPNGNPTGA